jgi:hypothetical protein
MTRRRTILVCNVYKSEKNKMRIDLLEQNNDSILLCMYVYMYSANAMAIHFCSAFYSSLRQLAM